MLSIQNLSFDYENTKVLHDLTFHVKKGEILSVLGESGSGKSTLLKLIHGELTPKKGTLLYKKEPIKNPQQQLVVGHPEIKYVPQDFELDNYITVQENVGKFISNFNLKEKKQRCEEILDLVELSALAHQKPTEISGGQQQRVALARAMVTKPQLLLLDEPFSQLDNWLHLTLREKLFHFIKQNKITTLLSTHNASDALGFSDQTLVLQEGKIIQKGAPHACYQLPNSIETAKRFGSFNFIPKEKCAAFSLPLEETKSGVLIYPEEVCIHKDSPFIGRVVSCRFVGRGYLIQAITNDICFHFYHEQECKEGSDIPLHIQQYRWV